MAEARAQRRLAALPAADLRGCSRLVGVDETGARARAAGATDDATRNSPETAKTGPTD